MSNFLPASENTHWAGELIQHVQPHKTTWYHPLDHLDPPGVFLAPVRPTCLEPEHTFPP